MVYMQWLDKIVDEIITLHPKGELIVSSGVSPSGKYHIGTLREVLTTDALLLGLQQRGRQVTHVHFVDDFDVLRKLPVGVPTDFERYFGIPLCDVPAPDGSKKSYADYYLDDFIKNIKTLGIDMQVIRSHQKYRSGYFVPTIEQALKQADTVKQCLETISGRHLDDQWSPIQVFEEGYLKKRTFISLDTKKKQLTYLDKNGDQQQTSYARGEVKLDWRIDWPARWALIGVHAEPFGRDHATKGGSYDTGIAIAKQVFKTEPPLPLPYAFINRTGETKKMSKSAGDTVTITELLQVLPPEVVRFFVLRYPPDKQLYFDLEEGITRLVDEFADFLNIAANDKSLAKELEIYTVGLKNSTVSRVPFSHLVASYQAALKDINQTLAIIARTEYKDIVRQEEAILRNELGFIDQWLSKWAPETVKFELSKSVEPTAFSDEEKDYLHRLADKIQKAPAEADGEWFHKAIYEFKESDDLPPQQLFKPLYRALINKNSGPRAGWFLSMLPREWLIQRLRLEA